MSFEGNWQLVINSPLGEHAASLSITETTESLAGSLTTEMGTVAVSGHANGDSVAFSARLPGPMGVMTLEFTGTVAESEVSGHIQVSGPIHPGPMGSARWRGARTEEEEVSQDATTMPRAPRIGHAAAHLGSLGGTGQGDGRPGSGGLEP